MDREGVYEIIDGVLSSDESVAAMCQPDKGVASYLEDENETSTYKSSSYDG